MLTSPSVKSGKVGSSLTLERSNTPQNFAENVERDINLISPCNYEALDAEIENEQPVREMLETVEEIALKKKKRRFKKLIRLIVTNKLWATDASAQHEEESDGSFKTDCGQKLTFNVNAYKPNIQTCGELSDESIEILSKPSRMRNNYEIKVVQKILYRLKCFDRYSILVKQELARVIDYDKFEDGRLIIKQGHPGSSFYFIVSGSVTVDRKEYDPIAGEYYNQRVGELNAGDCFGELALLHNTKRTASIRSRGTSEFLRVDKPDFDEVLRNCHQREWEMRINLLSSHPVFQGWTTRELKVANGHSKMKIYPPNTVMVSEEKQYPDRVFFIASGMCMVVRRLDMIRRMISEDKFRYVLPPVGHKKFRKCTVGAIDEKSLNILRGAERNYKNKYPRDVNETRFFTIAELKGNDYFNVGEDFDGLYVMSTGRVEIVQVATVAFSRHSTGKLLGEMQKKYIQLLPKVQDVFDKYVSERRWQCFKKNRVKDSNSKQKPLYEVDANDVPGIVNTDQIYYCHPADII